jgi:uncharacterized membrane protein YozB (DUF420 family)
MSSSADRRFFVFNAVVSVAALALLSWLLVFRGGPGAGGADLRFMPALNATLNATASVLLVAGWVAIKRRRPDVHRYFMVAAFVASALFLVGYLAYHAVHGDTKFGGTGAARAVYLTVLASHVLLSIGVVPLEEGVRPPQEGDALAAPHLAVRVGDGRRRLPHAAAVLPGVARDRRAGAPFAGLAFHERATRPMAKSSPTIIHSGLVTKRSRKRAPNQLSPSPCPPPQASASEGTTAKRTKSARCMRRFPCSRLANGEVPVVRARGARPAAQPGDGGVRGSALRSPCCGKWSRRER